MTGTSVLLVVASVSMVLAATNLTNPGLHLRSPGYPGPVLRPGEREGRGLWGAESQGKLSHFHRRKEDVYKWNVTRNSPKTVQLRLDFIDFQLAGPTLGHCTNDSFTISGADRNSMAVLPSALCGDLTGQHIYLSVTQSDQILLTVTLGPELGQRWHIQSTQVEAGDSLQAPAHCLQHYTALNGHIQSFNGGGQEPQMINHQYYSVCIAPVANFCDVLVSGDFDVDTEDAVSFGGQRRAGEGLGKGSRELHWKYSGTYVITVSSDGDNQAMKEGFALNYTLLPCY